MIRFSEEELLSLVPADIKRYPLFKGCGDPYPADTDWPTFGRSGSLSKAKQAMSFFMPHKHVQWMDGRGGNPTKHFSVNEVIKRVQDAEIKDKGVPANDKRAYNEAEFKWKLEMLRSKNDFEHRIKYPMMGIWAYTLIHRLDDTANFKCSAPHGDAQFPFVLKTKTKWSKNARTTRNCPDQMVFGSADSSTCCILWFAIYLEAWLTQHPNALFLWTASASEDKGPLNIKKNCRNNVKKLVWRNSEFQQLKDTVGEDSDEGLGAHSARKYAADKAKKQGAHPNQVEHRGRWLGKLNAKVVRQVCISDNEPCMNACVASLLCNGGPIKCELKEGKEVSDEWSRIICVPSIAKRHQQDPRLVRLLGVAMLFAAFDPTIAEFLPAIDADRIRNSFQEAHGVQEDNPVEKIHLSVLEVDKRLTVIEVPRDVQQQQQPAQGQQQHAPVAGLAAAQGEISDAQSLAFMQRMERSVMQENRALRNELAGLKSYVRGRFDILNTNQRRFGTALPSALQRQNPRRQVANRVHVANVARQQVATAATTATATAAPRQHQQQQQQQQQHQQQQQQQQQQGAAPQARVQRTTNVPTRGLIDPRARLANNLRSLHELWEECVCGIGDNEPAETFQGSEINQSRPFKQKHSCRKKIWRLQAHCVNAGLAIEAANSRIIRICGTEKITPLIHIITRDQKNPTYPFVNSQRFNPCFIINTG